MTTQRRRPQGFATLELVVALVVVLAAMTVAASLLLEAQRTTLFESARILDAAVPVALHQLRADAMAAHGGGGDADLAQPLELFWPSGVSVAYEVVGSDLVRRLSEPAGQRVVLQGVRSFSWEWSGLAKPLLEIEVVYEKARLPGARAVGGRRVDVHRRLESRTFFVTLRGGGGRGW